jgi:uncharacterized protein (TIGR02996 family)
MSEEAMLVEAILTESDDHVHRLVYADWLLENDPAREPLVRAQGVLGPSVRTVLRQKLVPIPAGTFLMGSPDDEKDRDPDEPAHKVKLTAPFYIGATPVTAGEFRAFVWETKYVTLAEQELGTGWNPTSGTWDRGAYHWRHPGWKQQADEPVVCLAWEDAVAFCAWLSEKDGRDYRLPTEAEWEYACRSWTTTPFFFGEDLLPEQANHNALWPYRERVGAPGPGRTTIVGSYPANDFGLYDMHGNVWEWCHDWYGESWYGTRARRDPHGPDQGNGRVLRGGSWYNPARDCRSALRRCGHPFFSRYNDGNTGFRLALSMKTKPQRRRRRAPRAG